MQINYSIIGDGKRIRFWEGPWCHNIPLSLSFPSLYNLANSLRMITDLWVDRSWYSNFERFFNDWEIATLQQFICKVRHCSPNPRNSDHIKRNGSTNRIHSVNSCIGFLEGGSQLSAPYRMLWNPLLPSKVSFFA